MKTDALNLLGGLSLAVGAPLAFIFFLIQPGGTFVATAEVSDSTGFMAAASSYPVLTNLTAMIIALGLAMMTFGLYAVQSSLRSSGMLGALSKAGFILLAYGILGWIMAQGLLFILAEQSSEPVYLVRLAILLVSGLVVALGFLIFSLALATRDGRGRIAALVVVVASLVALACYAVGISSASLLDPMIRIARICYVFWVVWSIFLGVGLIRANDPVS